MFNNYPIGKRPASNGGVFFLFMVYSTRMTQILRSADGSGFWCTKYYRVSRSFFEVDDVERVTQRRFTWFEVLSLILY